MAEANVTIVGCSDAFSCGGRGNTCFYLRATSAGVLIDCGGGALSGLKRLGLSTDDIDVIVLTHFHGDHFAGLPFVVFDAARMKRSKPLTIISPPGGKQKLEEAFSLFYPGSQKALEGLQLDYREYSGRDRLSAGPLQLESFPVLHTAETLPHGVRIMLDGITLAYTGDTEWTDLIPALFDGADLAICDCTFFDKQEKNHMSYATLREHLPELRCKRLLLTHFDDEMLRRLPDVGPECAFDGMQIAL